LTEPFLKAMLWATIVLGLLCGVLKEICRRE
jgi:hypothetical protein